MPLQYFVYLPLVVFLHIFGVQFSLSLSTVALKGRQFPEV